MTEDQFKINPFSLNQSTKFPEHFYTKPAGVKCFFQQLCLQLRPRGLSDIANTGGPPSAGVWPELHGRRWSTNLFAIRSTLSKRQMPLRHLDESHWRIDLQPDRLLWRLRPRRGATFPLKCSTSLLNCKRINRAADSETMKWRSVHIDRLCNDHT